MKERIIYFVGLVVMLLFLWGMASLFSDLTKVSEVIEPEPGVHCVVVSRMLNTSVDCWRTDVQNNL